MCSQLHGMRHCELHRRAELEGWYASSGHRVPLTLPSDVDELQRSCLSWHTVWWQCPACQSIRDCRPELTLSCSSQARSLNIHGRTLSAPCCCCHPRRGPAHNLRMLTPCIIGAWYQPVNPCLTAHFSTIFPTSALAVPDLYNFGSFQFMSPTADAWTSRYNTACLSVCDSAACLAPFPALDKSLVSARCKTRQGAKNWRGYQVFMPEFVPGELD